jgi:aspartate ammonia-lyase
MGRTQLQDAVPMTLGQEFSTFAVMLGEDEERLKEAARLICEINLGATAIGTVINTHPAYAQLACKHLSDVTGIALTTSPNLVEATQDVGSFVQLSGVLKRVAVKLSKTCNDLRLLSSGPRAGLGEINLPPVQAGSSIMPGKVNPVIVESLVMACAQVVGHDAAINLCCAGGHFELNAMMPLMTWDLLDSISLLANSADNVRERLLEGLEADRSRLEALLEQSLALATSLVPEIGYERAAALSKEAYASGRTIREVAVEKSGIPAERLAQLLDPARQV